MSKLIGIDLGTTNSVVSYLDQMGNPAIIHNDEGDNITPSVVLFTSAENILIGKEAKKDLDYENKAECFKRAMGSERVYNIFGKELTPVFLSSLILNKLFKDAKAQLGDVSEAIVTVPANFSNKARECTLEAGKMAGLNIKYIINEPTSAALYYAYKSGEVLSGNYIVYDLGGGTFDISVIKASGNDIEVLSSEGVSRLGGRDFDEKLFQLVAKKYKEQAGQQLDKEDYSLNQAEEDKKSLSKREEIRLSIGKGDKRVRIVIQKKEFEIAISSLITQADILCESAMKEAGLDVSDIKSVFLVGGSTRIPFVKESVEKIFKQTPLSLDNPDEVVSLGASIYCGYKANKKYLNPVQQSRINKVQIQEITNHFFGTIVLGYREECKMEELVNTILIKKGEKIPCSKSENLSYYSRWTILC